MRGEHSPRQASAHTSRGSSPHARGARVKGQPGVSGQGIIPACAGSTRGVPGARHPFWDHPRMRGEHQGFMIGGTLTKGSSPHARGARKDLTWAALPKGIIPACAGSTNLSPRACALVRDHPRMRGEHLSQFEVPKQARGSSPHARGAHTLRFSNRL